MTEETKVCRGCGNTKPITEFRADRPRCKECYKTKAIKRYMLDKSVRNEKTAEDSKYILENPNATRVCTQCKCDRLIAQFHWNSHKARRNNICVECCKNYKKEHYNNNKTRILFDMGVEKKRNNEHHIYKGAKKRAREKCREFSIDIGDVVVPELCPILGIPLQVSDGMWTDNSPTLDRIDSAKGYVKGNVCVISHRANRIKSNGTAEEHRKIAEYIEKNLPVDNADYSI